MKTRKRKPLPDVADRKAVKSWDNHRAITHGHYIMETVICQTEVSHG